MLSLVKILKVITMAIESVTAINLTTEKDSEVLSLINEFASLQHLKPTTALKQYILQTLPIKIRELRQSVIREDISASSSDNEDNNIPDKASQENSSEAKSD
jgi:hypothetical protein